MGAETDPRTREALQLARAGKKEQARHLLIDVLKQNREDFDAWMILAQVVDNHQEAVNSIRQALRLRPHDEKAKRYLEYLLGDQASEVPVKVLRTSEWLLAGLITASIIGIAFAWLLSSRSQAGQPRPLSDNQLAMADCSALITKALEVSDQGCQAVGRNEVCYGHNTVQARLVEGSDARFEQPGNIVPVHLLESFAASPLDQQKGEWGVGVFRLEANLPGTLPGQLVTLLVLGNTMLQNVSGDMHTFYFTSGLGGLTCDAMHFDGILVRMAEGAGYTFEANGADITLQGTSILQAATNERLTVTALSGTTTVSASDRVQSIRAGQAVTVPLGGSSGLEAEGPPSLPQEADDMLLSTTDCALSGTGCPAVGPPPADTSLPPASTATTPLVIATLPPTDEPTPTTQPSPTPTLPETPTGEIEPTITPEPTREPRPTREPKPTDEPEPTDEPRPTKEPKPSQEPDPR